MHTKTQNKRIIKGLTAKSYQNDILWSVFVLHGMSYTDMILVLDNVPWKNTKTKQQIFQVNNIFVLH